MADEVRVVDAFRLAESHAYLARALYPGSEMQQLRAVESMAYAVGHAVLSATEQMQVWLPHRRDADSRLRRVERRYRRALRAADMAIYLFLQRWPGGTLHQAAAHVGSLMPRRWSDAKPRGCDLKQRVWHPHRDAVHLAIPLELARLPFRRALARRNPELVALAVPGSLAKLVTTDHWPRQAAQVATMWYMHLRHLGLISQ